MGMMVLEALLPLGIIAGMLCIMGNAQYYIHKAAHGRVLLCFLDLNLSSFYMDPNRFDACLIDCSRSISGTICGMWIWREGTRRLLRSSLLRRVELGLFLLTT
ncbi:hypothetical protein QQ045_016277 [Rhodiola kirilowii]